MPHFFAFVLCPHSKARFPVHAIGAFVIAAAFTVFAGAQSVEPTVEKPAAPPATASVQGVVRDTIHHPIAGVTVCLQSEGAEPRTTRTDAKGKYSFSGVPQNVYTVSAEMKGYSTATSAPLVLGPISRAVDLTLAPTGEAKNSQPEFFDEPHFTVAGVTDTTNLGGHGSDAVVRNRDALAQAAESLRTDELRTDELRKDELRKSPSGASAADSSSSSAAEKALRDGDYSRARSEARSLLGGGVKSPDQEATLHHLLADASEKLGDSLEAVREYQRAAELNPSEANLFDWGANLLIHRAPEPAIEVFAKGNREFPHSVRMLEGMGAAWYALGSYDRAAEDFCRASDLDPDDANPYLFMGRMQASETGSSAAVKERLARFLRLQPRNPWANYYYAIILRQAPASEYAANLSRVTSLLQSAVQLDPKLGLAYYQLGVIYSEHKDLTKAIAAWQQAIAATPDLKEAHYRLAQAYRQTGDVSKAHAELGLYEQISRENAQEVERRRHELKQFVYELRDPSPATRR